MDIMKEIQTLLDKPELNHKEIDHLVSSIKERCWPKLKAKGMPANCSLCEMYIPCLRIDVHIICPWLAK